MSKIKSALELALERTADVEIDRDAVRRDELVRRGKAAAGKYLANPASVSLEDEIKSLSKDEKGPVVEGLVDTLLANLTLPRYRTDADRLPVIADGLGAICKKTGGDGKNLDYLMNQYSELFKQYLDNLDQLDEQMRAQWEPRLRQKEQQMRQQTGREVTLTPDQDPEFAKVLSEELARMDAQYGEVLSRGKEEIRKLLG